MATRHVFVCFIFRELHRQKPAPTVHYQRNMPDIEPLMQEWPAEFEELLNQVSVSLLCLYKLSFSWIHIQSNSVPVCRLAFPLLIWMLS